MASPVLPFRLCRNLAEHQRREGCPNTEKGYWRITLKSSFNNTNYGVPAARHSKTANILYGDWHVAPSIKVDNPLDPSEYLPFHATKYEHYNYYHYKK
ncbi:MAG: hypothetical protein IJJ26_13870 [Victivallales bacterium]|nr:hypothetical protein [Victivallales bacterium]